MQEFDELVEIMHRLRSECPWDKEQTLSSLRSYLLEECAEVLEAMQKAIDDKNYEHLVEELGDLLLQILFQSEIIKEESNQKSDIRHVLVNLKDKLIRRHPHIFANTKVDGAKEVLTQWEKIKEKEKSYKRESLLDDVPKTLTALQRASKLGKKSRKVGFDWEEPQQVWEKLLAELKELKEATTPDHKEEEFGDVLFCMAQWARHNEIDPEVALARANLKFESRFKFMEKTPGFPQLSLSEKEALWNKAKTHERSSN